MHSRMLRHRVVTGAVTLALALGGVAITGGAASAAGASADRAASAECQQARKDLSKAKKQLRKAKQTGSKAKVTKAKKKLEAKKAAKSRACATQPATEESVLREVQQGQLALDGLDLAALSSALPPELAAALGQLVAQLEGALDGIGAQAPGADTAQLEALLAAVQAMDVQGVVAALQAVGAQLGSLPGGPEALGTLVQMLQGGLPGGGSTPIQGIPDLQVLLGELTAQLGGLGGGLDPVAAPEQVEAAIAQLVATLEGIAGNIGGPSAGWLSALTEMVDQLGDLGALVPGGAGSGAVLTQIIETLMFFAQPGSDPLTALQGILDGGQLAGVLEFIGLGDLLGGILPGLGLR